METAMKCFDDIEDACRDYSQALTAFEEAKGTVLKTRDYLEITVRKCKADGLTSEEIDETLEKSGLWLSYDNLINW